MKNYSTSGVSPEALKRRLNNAAEQAALVSISTSYLISGAGINVGNSGGFCTRALSTPLHNSCAHNIRQNRRDAADFQFRHSPAIDLFSYLDHPASPTLPRSPNRAVFRDILKDGS